MSRTQISEKNIKDGGIENKDINTTKPGCALITKVIAGPGVSISSTGVDEGTGEVTITSTGSTPQTGFTCFRGGKPTNVLTNSNISCAQAGGPADVQ